MNPPKHRAGGGSLARRRRSLIALAAVTAVSAGCSTHHQATTSRGSGYSEAAYGSLPSFLPSTSLQPDSILTGTSERPALTVQGDSVRTQIADNIVTVTVTGPQVPGEGLPYQAETTTCTWTITLSAATHTLPISIASFSALDHFGVTHQLSPVPGRAPIPAALAPGASATFEVRTVMPVGEGLMRWAPSRHQAIASWDFEVEND